MGQFDGGILVVAVAIACACGALAPAADASLSVPTGGPPSLHRLRSVGRGRDRRFEAAVGGTDNGTTAGEQGGGFRHATWDQIALDGSDPGSTTIKPGHVVVPALSRLQPWGLELGPEIAVAGDGFQSV